MFRALGGDSKLDATRFSRAFMNEARFNRAVALDAPVHFHGTSLVSATFVDARLPRADFREARLQGASFVNADLSGARFEGANLADAGFRGVTLDGSSRKSIALGAKRWRAARFDEGTRQALHELSEGSTSRVESNEG